MDKEKTPHPQLPDDGLVPTARAVVDINRICNAKCQMCYYAYSDERWTKPFEVVFRELEAARDRGCTSVDFTGGEPTLHPDLPRIIAAAEAMGLHTCTISAGLSLQKVKQAVAAGCSEWLVSIHGFEKTHDRIVGAEGAWEKVNETVAFLNSAGCFVRVNCTLTKYNAADLPRLARHYAEVVRARIVNFINFNPHHEWGDNGNPAVARKLNEVQVRVSDVSASLREAIRYLDERHVWTNVRYFPFCALRGLESHICNNPQVMFDPYEWDYGIAPKTTAAYVAYSRYLQRTINTAEGPCATCGIRNVCGGANANYAKMFGFDEFGSYSEKSDYPYYFRSDLEADIVVPAFVPTETLARLLQDIPAKTAPPYNLILVGNHQSAARNRNYGLDRARSGFVIMCDDDIAELPYGWNRKLVYALKEHPEFAAISGRLMRPNGRPGDNTSQNYDLDRPLVRVDHIPTACCIFRRTEVRFDEKYVRAGWEDTDYFMQLRQAHGGEVGISNDVKVVHLNEEKNDGGASNAHNRDLYLSKWGKVPTDEISAERVRVVASLRAGAYGAALEGLCSILAAGKADASTFDQMGFACWKIGAHQDALQYFERALSMAPRNAAILRNFLEAAYALKRFDVAERFLRTRVRDLGPGHGFLLADCLRLQGRRSDALAVLNGLEPGQPGIDELRRAVEALPALPAPATPSATAANPA